MLTGVRLGEAARWALALTALYTALLLAALYPGEATSIQAVGAFVAKSGQATAMDLLWGCGGGMFGWFGGNTLAGYGDAVKSLGEAMRGAPRWQVALRAIPLAFRYSSLVSKIFVFGGPVGVAVSFGLACGFG